ncbi:hypothetical protein CIHG_05358 [Coccidioides immitis H538.4]|uniref:Uncharacterized protein n=2 Tax=Coccidioides immitis TaxID=5501 RepID=A0A0J8RTU1_COCIT|nr:hypothetical protein CIRG_02141 [Coccidioides immitis RMSCC 2394]KMU88187.1 hypothetical protein CIHG_05358 [Coccidioides immitis H538.4]
MHPAIVHLASQNNLNGDENITGLDMGTANILALQEVFQTPWS